ncbi:hypothetical protein D3C76_846680 [compost metagenome]
MALAQRFEKVLACLLRPLAALLADRQLQAHGHHAAPAPIILRNLDQQLQALGRATEILAMQAPFAGSAAGDYLDFQGGPQPFSMALGDFFDALQHRIGLRLIAALLQPAHAHGQCTGQ